MSSAEGLVEARGAFERGELAEAEAKARALLADAAARADHRGEGEALLLLGEIAYDRLDRALTRELLTSALTRFERVCEPGDALLRLSATALALGLIEDEPAMARVLVARAVDGLSEPQAGAPTIEIRLFTWIAIAHIARGEPTKALTLLDRLAEIVAGVESVEAANVQLQRATALRMLSSERAIDALEACLTLRRRVLGERAPRVGMTSCELGASLFGVGREQEAEARLDEGLEVLSGTELARSARLAPMLAVKAMLEHMRGGGASSAALLKRCVELEQRAHGGVPSHGYPIAVLVARMFHEMGMVSEAVALCMGALPALEARADASDEACLEATMLVLNHMRDTGAFKQLIARFEPRSRALHKLPTHPGRVLHCIDNTLAVAYLNLRRLPEAERYATVYLRDIERSPGIETMQGVAALSNLAAVLERRGKGTEAAGLRRQASDINERISGEPPPLLSTRRVRGKA